MSSARHKSRPTRRTKSSDSSEKKEVLSLRKSVQKRILGDVFESATGMFDMRTASSVVFLDANRRSRGL